jgi:hypothetical protein
MANAKRLIEEKKAQLGIKTITTTATTVKIFL